MNVFPRLRHLLQSDGAQACRLLVLLIPVQFVSFFTASVLSYPGSRALFLLFLIF